jgi:hypothetical protein
VIASAPFCARRPDRNGVRAFPFAFLIRLMALDSRAYANLPAKSCSSFFANCFTNLASEEQRKHSLPYLLRCTF